MIKAMKQALEALEQCLYPQSMQIKAITSLRQAIAEAEKQRQWVGLTVEEIADIAADVYGAAHCDDVTFATKLQNRLKEKNT